MLVVDDGDDPAAQRTFPGELPSWNETQKTFPFGLEAGTNGLKLISRKRRWARHSFKQQLISVISVDGNWELYWTLVSRRSSLSPGGGQVRGWMWTACHRGKKLLPDPPPRSVVGEVLAGTALDQAKPDRENPKCKKKSKSFTKLSYLKPKTLIQAA